MDVYLRVDGGTGAAIAVADGDTKTALDVLGRRMRLVVPQVVDRTTGEVRDTAAFVELPPQMLGSLLASSRALPDETGSVAAVLAHRVSRRAVLVGTFDDVAAARSWWDAPRNRLAGNPAMIMVVMPFVGPECGR
jgi:hypothetical protein